VVSKCADHVAVGQDDAELGEQRDGRVDICFLRNEWNDWFVVVDLS
jgi:hypothetical protein